jgi:hypothetical protein
VGFIILTVNLQTNPLNKKHFIDFVCEFTAKIIEHTIASYEISDLI